MAGPGMGPIGVMPHLVPFLPGHSVISTGVSKALVLLPQHPGRQYPDDFLHCHDGCSWSDRSNQSSDSQCHIARRLEPYYPVVYKGKQALVALHFGSGDR